jgi:putative phosphoribosyl transferase
MSLASYNFEDTVGISVGDDNIYGTLVIPESAWAAVIFAHGSGSSRHSPRNFAVAKSLHEVGLATLLVDLLTPAEERVDQFTAQYRFDIDRLTERLLAASAWVESNCSQYHFPLGYFGASTGAAAALTAAARRPNIDAVVSRGGRPDLAADELEKVTAPTLLIVGGLDRPVIELNKTAFDRLARTAHKELTIVPGATHLFEEKGALSEVAQLAAQWFVRYLGKAADRENLNRASHETREANSIR